MRVLRLLGSQPARAPPPLHVASLGLPINAAQSHASWQNPPRGPPQTSKGDERHWNPLASEARCRLYWDQRCLIKSRPASVMWTQLCLGGSTLPSAKENPASSATSWLVTPSLWFRSRSLSVSAHGSAGQRGWRGHGATHQLGASGDSLLDPLPVCPGSGAGPSAGDAASGFGVLLPPKPVRHCLLLSAGGLYCHPPHRASGN